MTTDFLELELAAEIAHREYVESCTQLRHASWGALAYSATFSAINAVLYVIFGHWWSAAAAGFCASSAMQAATSLWLHRNDPRR